MSNKKGFNFAVVIPAYNEEATIRDVVERCLQQCNKVIVVDDGSNDETISKLNGLAITLIKHETNLGKAASLWDGFNEAIKDNIDVIITLDGDNQHSPEDIPLLLSKNESHPEQIIIGARLADKSSIPAKRYYANKIANFWIAWAAGYPLSDSQSGFRLYPVSLFNNLTISTSKNSSFVFESEIIIKAAQRGIYSQAVSIPAIYMKNARASHFRGVRDITLITLMVAKSLFTRGFYLQGLYRSTLKPLLLQSKKKIDFDGYLMMLFSTLIIIITAGLSLFITWLYILRIACTPSAKFAEIPISLILGKCLVNQQPDADFISRLDRAKLVLLDKKMNTTYILGGKLHNADISESLAGKNYLIQAGISSQRIFLEEKSRNTLENLKNISSIHNIKSNSVLLITNRYHLARSLIMSKGFKIEVKSCPAENKFTYKPMEIFKTIIEAFYLHWYLTGKYWANLTNNKRMLDRITN